jgi:hypothetical protein
MGEGKHARFNVESGGCRARAVSFGTGGRLPVAEGEPADATFTLEVNEWNGVSEPRLVLRQASPSAAAADERAVIEDAAVKGAAVEEAAGEGVIAEDPTGELVLFALP